LLPGLFEDGGELVVLCHGTVETLPHAAELVLEVLHAGWSVTDTAAQDGDLLFEGSDNTPQLSGVVRSPSFVHGLPPGLGRLV
jgi:hypothetical protein